MRMYICHNLLALLTLIIPTMSINSRNLFIVSNKLHGLGTLIYALTFFTWASIHCNLILLFFERAISLLTVRFELYLVLSLYFLQLLSL